MPAVTLKTGKRLAIRMLRFISPAVEQRLRWRWQLVFLYRLPSLRWRFLRDTSQHGEYWALRRMIDATVPPFFVDVGANDGFRHSNSYPFIQAGWSAILVEPNPQVFENLRTRYRDNPNVRTINCACGQTEGVLPLF